MKSTHFIRINDKDNDSNDQDNNDNFGVNDDCHDYDNQSVNYLVF